MVFILGAGIYYLTTQNNGKNNTASPQTQASQEQSSSGSESSPPPWPESFGDYIKISFEQTDNTSESEGVGYVHKSQNLTFVASHTKEAAEIEKIKTALKDTRSEGELTCGFSNDADEYASCFIPLDGGVMVTVLATNEVEKPTVDDVMVTTKEFLEAWR